MHDWLHDERKGRWFIVLDNVDDASFLLEARSAGHDLERSSVEGKSRQPLISYLPQRKHGSVLVTTRSKNAARGLVSERDIVMVDPMEIGNALSLLQKKLGKQETDEDVVELATGLECMPLARAQAAAYIVQQRPRCSVQQYLANFRRSDCKKAALFNNKNIQVREELRRDYEARNSIIITWQISFDHFRETRPSAAGLLSLMSFFDRQGIPEELLRAKLGEEPAQQEQDERNSKREAWEEDSASQSSTGEDGFEDHIQTLRDYSFVSANADGVSFEMHGLVQLATRKWLQVHNEVEQWQQRFVSTLCDAFPTGEYENWAVCQRLFAHAKSAAEQRPAREGSLREWASLLYKAAWYALGVGNWVEAEAMSLQSMKTRRKILGADNQDTLQSMVIVGEVYRSRGQWDTARKLQEQVMQTSKIKLGEDHPDTLMSMANLASTYRDQARWADAEALEVQVIESFKTKLGADHPDTLTSLNNLAFTLKARGFYKQCCFPHG